MTSLNNKDTTKVYLYNRKMAGEVFDGASISINPTKRYIAGKKE